VDEAPVKVISGEAAFWHTAIVPEMVAVGRGFTVMTALPLWSCEHVVALPSCTLIRLYENKPVIFVGAGTVTLFPTTVVTIWLPPPLILYVKV
jgi:hypothetical protein